MNTYLVVKNVKNTLGMNKHSNIADIRLAEDVFLRDIAAVLSPGCFRRAAQRVQGGYEIFGRQDVSLVR